jgi:cbb3-type cytochrome oxidase maturation protein
MSVLFIALPVALALAGLAVGAFVFSVRDGQFDDLDTPPLRILFDDLPEKQHRVGERPDSTVAYTSQQTQSDRVSASGSSGSWLTSHKPVKQART